MGAPEQPAARDEGVLRLHTLGGLSLRNDGVALDERQAAAFAELARRKRKLALLSVLVRSTRPLSRDLLADMFWPEEEPARARHSLNDALSHLRRVLGPDALGARGGDVTLTPHAQLWCDASAFDAAITAGDASGAVALYGGPFLDGVYLEQAMRFEEWSTRQREQLRRAFVAGCDEVCKAPLTAESAGPIADVARRWLDAAPESSPAAQRWLQALAAPETRDALRGATEAYTRICRDLDEQFGAGPDAALAALGAELRQRLAAQLDAAIIEETAAPLLRAHPTAPRAHVAADPAALPAAPPEARADALLNAPGTVPSVSGPSRQWPRRVTMSALLAIGVLALALVWQRRPAAGGDAAETRPWLVVTATTSAAGTDRAQLHRLVSLALETSLAADASLDVLPPGRVRNVLRLMGRGDSIALDEATAVDVAARTGVGFIVVPSLLQVGTRFTVSARVLRPDGGDVVATVSRRADSLDELLPVTEAIVADIGRAVRKSSPTERRGRALPPATTASLVALRHFATAIDAENRSAWDTARAAYQAATNVDSLFALAWLRLGALEYQLNRGSDGERAFARALGLAARVTPREQAFLRASVFRWRRQSDSAIAVMQAWLVVNPRDRQAQSTVAYDLLLARRHAEAQVAYRDLLATDSLDANAWANLASSAAAVATTESRQEAQRAYARAFALWPDGRTDATLNHEWGAVWAAAGVSDSAAAIYALMLKETPAQRARGLRSLAHLALWDGHFAESARRFTEVVGLEVAGQRWLGALRARLLLADALEQSGDTISAAAQRDSAQTLAMRPEVQEPVVLYWLGKPLARHGQREAGKAVLRALQARVQPANPRHRAAALLLTGELQLADGRTAEGLARIDSGATLDSTAITLESRAYATLRHGLMTRDRRLLEQAATLFATLAQAPRFGWEGTLPQILAPLYEGAAYEALGDGGRARAAFARLAASRPRADRAWPAKAIARAKLEARSTPVIVR